LDPASSHSAKRHKDESNSFDSQDTLETSREHSQKLKISTFSLEEETPLNGTVNFLECPESLSKIEETKAVVVTEAISEDDGAFGAETLNYMISREQAYSPDPYYIDKYQPDLTWAMRLILADWMMEVCMEFQLKRETYHYSLNFVDRFLTAVPRVSKAELQLVGVTALYVAAKVEEVCTPKIKDFAKSTDNGYSVEQIRKTELIMIKVSSKKFIKNVESEVAANTSNLKHVGKLVYEPMGHIHTVQ